MLSHKSIFITVAVFYLFIIPFFFHPDLKIITFLSQFLTQGVGNIYQFIATHPDQSHLGPFVYPPLAYFFLGLVFPVLKLLAGPSFTQWLAMGNDAVAIPHIFRFLFLIKLPLILVHLTAGFYLAKLVLGYRAQKLALLVWFFNPVSIYVIGLMGQIDIWPVLATILAVMWSKDKPYLAALALGIGAAFKTYPLLLLPFLALLSSRKNFTSLAIFVTGLLPFIVSILPYLTTPQFYTDTLASGLSQRIFDLSLSVGFNERILLIPAYLIILVLLAFHSHRGMVKHFWHYALAVTLLPIAFSHFHPQWMLWSLPFISLFLAQKWQTLPAMGLFLGYLGTVALIPDKFLTLGLVSPLQPEILFLPPLASLLPQAVLVQSLFHTLFAASAVWITWQAFTKLEHV